MFCTPQGAVPEPGAISYIFSTQSDCAQKATVEDCNDEESILLNAGPWAAGSALLEEIRTPPTPPDHGELINHDHNADILSPASHVPAQPQPEPAYDGKLREAPSVEIAARGLKDIAKLLRSNTDHFVRH
jgi:hypothetical protein